MLVLTRGILKVIKELRKANNPIAVVQGNHDTGDKYGFLNGRDPSLMISPGFYWKWWSSIWRLLKELLLQRFWWKEDKSDYPQHSWCMDVRRRWEG